MALAVVTLLVVLAAVYPIIPVNGEPFSEIGVLGPTQQIGGYPTNVTAGQRFELYGYIGNHEGVASYYQFVVKLGGQNTTVTNSTAADVPVVMSSYHVLADNQTVTFPFGMSVNSTGVNEKLIFELWSFNSTSESFAYTGLWGQLFLNVTK
jgi:uncharacterized membrane protein